MTFLPLLVNLFFLHKAKKIIIAPRGEFSKGALSLKSIKKTMYLNLIKLCKIFDNVKWHASSLYEQEEIIQGAIVAALADLLTQEDALPDDPQQILNEKLWKGGGGKSDEWLAAELKRIEAKHGR